MVETFNPITGQVEEVIAASSAPPGSFDVTQVEIDFGATPISDKVFTITDANITGTSQVIATVVYEDTTDNTADEASELLVVAGKPVAGSCSLLAYSPNSLVRGKFKINYTIG